MTHIGGLEPGNDSWGTPELAPEVVVGCPFVDIGLGSKLLGHILPATHVRDPEQRQEWKYDLP